MIGAARQGDAIDTATLFDLTGRTALVTGGSRGIGRMIAEGFLQAGASVYISSRRADACERTASELSAAGPCHALPANVADDADRGRLVRALGERTDRLDILVNNAGAAWGAPYAAFPESGFRKVLELNVTALFFLTRDLTPLLAAAATPEDPARVINIGSMDGIKAPDGARHRHVPLLGQQGRRPPPDAVAGPRAGPPAHHRERGGAGVLPQQDDRGVAGAVRGRDRATRPRYAGSADPRTWPASPSTWRRAPAPTPPAR